MNISEDWFFSTIGEGNSLSVDDKGIIHCSACKNSSKWAARDYVGNDTYMHMCYHCGAQTFDDEYYPYKDLNDEVDYETLQARWFKTYHKLYMNRNRDEKAAPSS